MVLLLYCISEYSEDGELRRLLYIYRNTETNETTWEKPSEIAVDLEPSRCTIAL